MVVVTNRIPVAKGHEIDFEDRFKRRVHLVDRHPGFIRNEVHRPRAMKFEHERDTWVEDPEAQGYYEVKTWWRSFADFVAWTESPDFAEAHANRPPRPPGEGVCARARPPRTRKGRALLRGTDPPGRGPLPVWPGAGRAGPQGFPGVFARRAPRFAPPPPPADPRLGAVAGRGRAAA